MPTDLQTAGFRAAVRVAAILDTTGRVIEAEVGDSRVVQDPFIRAAIQERLRDGEPGVEIPTEAQAAMRFERMALAWVHHLEYRPATVRGRPVKLLVCVPVTFGGS